jgi:hypothetical protein
VIRTQRLGTRALSVALAVAALACASAAAAVPTYSVQVRAHLTPVAGTTAAGRFSGSVVLSGLRSAKAGPVLPRNGTGWRLTWSLQLPALSGTKTAALRIMAANGAAPITRVLCTGCATRPTGTMKLTASQAIRIAGSHAVVVVRTASASLRGAVEASARASGSPRT